MPCLSEQLLLQAPKLLRNFIWAGFKSLPILGVGPKGGSLFAYLKKWEVTWLSKWGRDSVERTKPPLRLLDLENRAEPMHCVRGCCQTMTTGVMVSTGVLIPVWSVTVCRLGPPAPGLLYCFGLTNSIETFDRFSQTSSENAGAFQTQGRTCSVQPNTLGEAVWSVASEERGRQVWGWEEIGGDKSSLCVTAKLWRCLSDFFWQVFALSVG